MPKAPRRVKRPARKIPKARAPRIYRPPIRKRLGPIARRQTIQTDAPGIKPGWIQATQPEWNVYWWLTIRKKFIPDYDFSFQSSLGGGRLEYGGLVVDFLLPDIMGGLVLNPIGEHWHLETSEQRAKLVDDQRRLQSDYGYTVVYIREDDIITPGRLDYVMEQALVGITLFNINGS